jgi:hypothetical protein
MRDSHGFIWFCTRDGLSMFDRYHFANYKIRLKLKGPSFFGNRSLTQKRVSAAKGWATP